MAIAFVNGSRGGNTASANSIVSTAASLTAGNWTAVGYVIDDNTIAPSGVPTDTAGNTYVQVGTTQIITSAPAMCMFQAFNCLGNAANIVTLNLTGSSIYRAWARWQFSGVPVTNPYISPFQFSQSASGTAMSTASLSHGSGEAVIAVIGVNFNSGGGITAGGSGYTFNAFGITGDATASYADEYHITSADEATAMTAGAAGPWGMFAAAFGTPTATTAARRLALLGVG